MNGSDMSDATKLGLTILILCFLVGIVFQLFTMARSLTSTSSNRLQSSINQISDMSYASYDNQVVYGSTVTSAVAQFSADKMVVVIQNFVGSVDSSPIKTGAPADTVSVVNPANSLPSSGTGAYYGYALDGNKITLEGTYYVGTLDTSSGAKNSDTTYLKKSGEESVYINDALRYSAYLIRDNTSEVIGVYFQQLP